MKEHSTKDWFVPFRDRLDFGDRVVVFNGPGRDCCFRAPRFRRVLFSLDVRS